MTLIDLQGKALYSGSKTVKKALLGTNMFYSLGPAPGAFAIPDMYSDTIKGSGEKLDIYGFQLDSYSGSYSRFTSFSFPALGYGGPVGSRYFVSSIKNDAMSESGGSIPLGAQQGAVFKKHVPGVIGNYVLKYDAKNYPNETNAGYFSKTYTTSDNIGSYKEYTSEWKTYYEPPVRIKSSTDGYDFYMRLQKLPGDKGRVQFTNFEFIPAELL